MVAKASLHRRNAALPSLPEVVPGAVARRRHARLEGRERPARVPMRAPAFVEDRRRALVTGKRSLGRRAVTSPEQSAGRTVPFVVPGLVKGRRAGFARGGGEMREVV